MRAKWPYLRVRLTPIDWRRTETKCRVCKRSFLLELIAYGRGVSKAKWPICLECREEGWTYLTARSRLFICPRKIYVRQNGSRPSLYRESDLERSRERVNQYRKANRQKVRACKRAYWSSERGMDLKVVSERLRLGWSLFAARNAPVSSGPRKGHIPNVGAL
ncbi:hypothetical protein LCGC14_0382410 [marine sediment metagenome]|uniref:Uncharacterized protein n=1 Tax=marine sediment metagenome TaxID=412755 RepID=A0A0F9TK00_9ZZZZ